MLWFGKRETQAVERDLIAPAALGVEFDTALFRAHMNSLIECAREDGGIERYVESLGAKQRLFGEALTEASLASFDDEKLVALLDAVFTARRKLHPVLAELGIHATAAAIRELLYGEAELGQRVAAFVAALPIRDGDGRDARRRASRLRHAAHDFACELLHFREPARYPLMVHWVWDSDTMSGALREFVRDPDRAEKLPLDVRPETFEGARRWLAGEIEGQGIYRDVPLWIDLVKAAAYTHYFRSMTGGVLGSDFERGSRPEEQVKKLLGIDGERRGGRTRIKREDTQRNDTISGAA